MRATASTPPPAVTFTTMRTGRCGYGPSAGAAACAPAQINIAASGFSVEYFKSDSPHAPFYVTRPVSVWFEPAIVRAGCRRSAPRPPTFFQPGLDEALEIFGGCPSPPRFPSKYIGG